MVTFMCHAMLRDALIAGKILFLDVFVRMFLDTVKKIAFTSAGGHYPIH